jgi:hypothetical protein
MKNEYLDYIEHLENNKIGYYLKREDDGVTVTSSEGVKKFNWSNEEIK